MNEQKQTVAIASFSPKVMLDNIARARKIVQAIRQNDGVGSEGDELVIHRLIQDIDILVEITGGLRAAYDSLYAQYETLSQTFSNHREQANSIKQVYERMLNERNERIKELEQQLGLRPTETT